VTLPEYSAAAGLLTILSGSTILLNFRSERVPHVSGSHSTRIPRCLHEPTDGILLVPPPPPPSTLMYGPSYAIVSSMYCILAGLVVNVNGSFSSRSLDFSFSKRLLRFFYGLHGARLFRPRFDRTVAAHGIPFTFPIVMQVTGRERNEKHLDQVTRRYYLHVRVSLKNYTKRMAFLNKNTDLIGIFESFR